MKKAFTLIEVLVSIVLLVIISLFVSSTIQQTRSNNHIFAKELKNKQRVEILSSMIYMDLFEASKINIKNFKRYSVLSLKSKNSIYSISNPYIIWLVLKDKNSLIRFESAKKITLPIPKEDMNRIFADLTIIKCDNFTITPSKDKKNYLVFIKIKNYRPILFEVKKL